MAKDIVFYMIEATQVENISGNLLTPYLDQIYIGAHTRLASYVRGAKIKEKSIAEDFKQELQEILENRHGKIFTVVREVKIYGASKYTLEKVENNTKVVVARMKTGNYASNCRVAF